MRQHGFSLVSLMVGIALSLVCVVAALHTYRASVLNGRSAATHARASNATAALALQISKLLPQAGWGMGAAEANPGGKANTDLVLLQEASATTRQLGGQLVSIASGSQAGNAMVWATALEGSVQCRALVIDPARGVELWGPQACTSAVAGHLAQWEQKVTLVAPDVLPRLQLQTTVGSCWPFGGGLARESVQVRVTGTSYALAPTCLPNIQG